ncbi:porin [Variovorax saccharolyticus]|uniref:porin n=1 Tax=Variovorax saccharolyticus TaxID=3053516 RepID=UPI002574E2AA|nr:porin [Variovorax sp. J22R187]MDM0021275.1 porin [Variovorax sp. J22R187]
MKRASLAVAAWSAVCASSVAFAQTSVVQGPVTASSVTLFGVADAVVGYGSGSYTHRTQLYSSGNSASRIGFRGLEDLGGGLAAGFWLEAGVAYDTGTGVAGNTNNQASGATSADAMSWNRRSTVSLIDQWGELRLGRDFTAHYRNRTDVDPFDNNGVGTIQPQVGSIAGPTSTRASNMVGYLLPPGLGGFFGELQYFMGENPNHTPASDDGNGYSGRIGWRSGPFGIAVAAGHTDYQRTLNNGDITSANVGASYDFKIFKVSAGYYHDKVDSLPEVTATGYALGVIVPVGFDQLKFAWSRYGTDAIGNPAARKLSLGYVYNFSRRSVAYATYSHVSNSGGSAVGLNGALTAPDRSSNGYDLGLRYSF